MKTLIDAIKDFEGLRLKAYRDSGGVLTIGFGHTGRDVYDGQQITIEQANDLLRKDLNNVYAQIDSLHLPVNANQRDAIADFVFNLGIGTFKGSTLYRKIKENAPINEIQAQFRRWVYCKGKMLNGLVKRREYEATLYSM